MSLKRKLQNDDSDASEPSNSRPRVTAETSTIPYPTKTTTQTPFQKPVQVLSFSYDDNHTFQFNDSALRYYVDPPIRAKLDYGYDRWIKREDDRGRIDSLLRGISEAKAPLHGVGVVSWRGVMTKILLAPYEEREGWDLNVMLLGDTMYFEEHATEAQLKEKNSTSGRQRLQMYYGYAFESYCTTDELPSTTQKASTHGVPRGWNGDVNTNVQWCSVVRTKLGNTRLLIGGEVDCVRDEYTGQPDTFVELKTSLALRGPQDRPRFEKKLLKFYLQSFLLGVPEIVVGFRTHSGEISAVESFKTIELPRLVRGKPGAWDPMLCLDWGNQFLIFLKETLLRQSSLSDRLSDTPPVWRVKFLPNDRARVEMLDERGVEEVRGDGDRVGFLPRWFWKEQVDDNEWESHDIKSVLSSGPAVAPPTASGWRI